MGFYQYFTIGQRLVVNFCALQKQAKLIKLYICATKHKVNTYDEYLTRSDNCVSTSRWPPSAKCTTWLKPIEENLS